MEVLNSVFLPMLAGHLIADFWLQPRSWVLHKRENGLKSLKLILHSVIASALPVIFIFRLNLWWFFPVIFVVHLLTDLLKTRLKDNIFTFLSDQIIHISVLLILAVWGTKEQILPETANLWLYISGFVFVTNPAGIFTGLFLNVVITDKTDKTAYDVSAWIGILERILIFVFILSGQFSAIGFLIAAKSIFRFNDTREEGNKKAEYFLLGTLISFTIAIVTGLIINYTAGLQSVL